MEIGQYEGNYFDHGSAFEEITEPSGEKRTRGGARPGAGRKREYDEQAVRLKCPLSMSSLANAFILILVKFSKQAANHAFACRIDGKDVEWKGGGRRQWSNADAIQSTFSIRIEKGYDEKLFLLAFKRSRPDGVAFDSFWNGKGEVTLRWQRADEVARVMMEYGRLYAIRNKLPKDLQETYDSIPDPRDREDIEDWLNDL